MRNVFWALKPERAKPALQLVNASFAPTPDELISSRPGLTAADAAAALGCDPRKSPLALWQEKTANKAIPVGSTLSTPMDACPGEISSPSFWSNLLEPLIASVYTRRTGNRLKRINAVRSRSEQPWMLANVGWEVIGAPGVQLFEAVSVGADDLPLWADGFPAHLRLNVMHLLAVTGKHSADIAVLLGGLELRIFRIERDEEVIERLARKETAFWSCVERGEAPSEGGAQLTLNLASEPASAEVPH